MKTCSTQQTRPDAKASKAGDENFTRATAAAKRDETSVHDDERLRSRVDELLAGHRAARAVGHHERARALYVEAREALKALDEGSSYEARLEAHARLLAAFEAMPQSARIGVSSRFEWRARASTVRFLSHEARRFVGDVASVRPRRATAASVLSALARAHFTRLLEGDVSCASVSRDGIELLVRRDVDRSEREEDLAWGIAMSAMRVALREIRGGLRSDDLLSAEATTRLAAQIREMARRSAEELASVNRGRA